MSPTPACTVSVPQDAPLSGKDLHSVPCKIDYTGQANVSGYFIRSHAENGTLSAAFRGRGLEGCQLALPADYQLFVVKEKLNSAGGTRRFTVLDSRNNFTQWEWDREAGSNSAPARVFTSLRVANAMAED